MFLSHGEQHWQVKKQRELMKTQLTDIEVQAEAIPFSIELKREAGCELRPSPMDFVSDLKALMFHLLDEKDRFAKNIN